MKEPHDKRVITVCLMGNPNSGKTTIFNNLTGSRQRVGNYPGVTVEKVEGWCEHRGVRIRFVDLPGTYSLNAYSIDQIIARDFIIENNPDIVIDVVDASNIERNLYLATQLKELEVPLVIALNMSDMLEKKGHFIDLEKLSWLFGAKFIKTIGHKKEGMDDLLDLVIDIVEGRKEIKHSSIQYGSEVEEEIEKIVPIINNLPLDEIGKNRWIAVKLLENDENVIKKITDNGADSDLKLLMSAVKSRKHLKTVYGRSCDSIITDERYGFINGALKESAERIRPSKIAVSDSIDNIILNRVLGLPIFAIIMFLIFFVSVDLSAPLIDFVESIFTSLSDFAKANIPKGNLQSLITDGIIGGVGGVMTFVPQIMIMFLCIALMEATGYMSRAAFVIDRLMHKLGLHGKSFIPMLIGFGCNVPGLMAARTLENRKDRLTTMLATTFMSCGARFPVYLLITGALFSRRYGSWVIFSIYILGVVVAVLTAKIFRSYVYKGESSPFVMELPPYRLPTIRGIFHQMWNKTSSYLKKAGTIILAAAVLFWFLSNFPKMSPKEETKYKKMTEKVKTGFSMKMNSVFRMANPNGHILSEKDFVNNKAFKNVNTKMMLIQSNYQKQINDIKPDTSVYKILTKEKNIKIRALKKSSGTMLKAVLTYKRILKKKNKLLKDIEYIKTADHKKNSYAGKVGSFVSPILAPMGLDNWRVSISLIAGFAAKEVIVGTMGAIYAVGEETDENSASLRHRILSDRFFQRGKPVASSKVVRKNGRYFIKGSSTPVILRDGKFYTSDLMVALSFMVFVLLYLPCQAVVATYIKEAGWKQTLVMVGYTSFVAYTISTIVYQTGRFLGLG